MLVESELFVAQPQPRVSALVSAVKHYTRPQSKETDGTGYTLLFAHATGMHKECWEPTIAALLERPCVRDAWAFEWPNHGEGALINAELLQARTEAMRSAEWGALLAAFANTRDLQPESTVAIGHSNGSTAFILSTKQFASSPYAALILVEPVMLPRKVYEKHKNVISVGTNFINKAVSKRRERWPSREEALRWMSGRPPWKQWDKRVLQLFVNHAIVPISADGPEVRLACSKASEAAPNLDHEPHHQAQDIYYALRRAGVPVHFIFGDAPEPVPFLPTFQRAAILDTSSGEPSASSVQTIHSAGHLIAQQTPDELALCIANVLERMPRVSGRTLATAKL